MKLYLDYCESCESPYMKNKVKESLAVGLTEGPVTVYNFFFLMELGFCHLFVIDLGKGIY